MPCLGCLSAKRIAKGVRQAGEVFVVKNMLHVITIGSIFEPQKGSRGSREEDPAPENVCSPPYPSSSSSSILFLCLLCFACKKSILVRRWRAAV